MSKTPSGLQNSQNKHACACNWIECRTYFEDIHRDASVSHPWNRDMVTIKLNKGCAKSTALWCSVIYHLNLNPSAMETDTLYVAPHHWSVELLRDMEKDGRKMRMSTPLTANQAAKYDTEFLKTSNSGVRALYVEANRAENLLGRYNHSFTMEKEWKKKKYEFVRAPTVLKKEVAEFVASLRPARQEPSTLTEADTRPAMQNTHVNGQEQGRPDADIASKRKRESDLEMDYTNKRARLHCSSPVIPDETQSAPRDNVGAGRRMRQTKLSLTAVPKVGDSRHGARAVELADQDFSRVARVDFTPSNQSIILSLLKDVSNTENIEVITTALSRIADHCDDEDEQAITHKDEFLIAGGYVCIVEVLKKWSEIGLIIEQGLRTLATVLTGHASKLSNFGLAEAILTAMQDYSDDLNIQVTGLDALRLLLAGSPDNVEVMVLAGGSQIVLQAMASFFDDLFVQSTGCKILRRAGRDVRLAKLVMMTPNFASILSNIMCQSADKNAREEAKKTLSTITEKVDVST